MIELINISCEIAGKKILIDVSLNVEEGKILALLGPSGSGKTTLLRVMAGLMRPYRGEIRIDGRIASSPTDMVSPAKRRMAMIFQNLALWPHMTVRQNIEFVVDGRGKKPKREIDNKIDQLLSLMYLKEHQGRYPSELSGGERQRLAIARALATEPGYLLMDEPFSNLDDLLKSELLQLTLSLKREHNMAVIYVTHNVDEALLIGDKVAIIRNGAIRKVWNDEALRALTKEEVLKSYA